MSSQAVRDVERIIRSSGESAKIYRPGNASAKVNGVVPGALTLISEVPIEMNFLTPKDLAEIGASALASVLPGSSIVENDTIEVAGTRYMATEVKPENLEGSITHIVLHLEKLEAANG